MFPYSEEIWIRSESVASPNRRNSSRRWEALPAYAIASASRCSSCARIMRSCAIPAERSSARRSLGRDASSASVNSSARFMLASAFSGSPRFS